MARTEKRGIPIEGKHQSDLANKTLAKEAYVSPRLLEYGSIAKLTQTGAATQGDFLAMMACL